MNHPVHPTAEKGKILESLRDQNVRTVVLSGEAGVGKTWMAREVSKSAISEGFCGPLWIIPEYFHEGRSHIEIIEIICYHLCAYPLTSMEPEDVGHNADVVDEKKVEPEAMKQLIIKRLEQMRSGNPEHKGEIGAGTTGASVKKPYLLVVLDGTLEGDEEEIRRVLRTLFPAEPDFFKVIVTRRGGSNERNGEIQPEVSRFHVGFLSGDESSALLKTTVNEKILKARDYERLCSAVVKGSSGHPGAILMVAKALNHLGNSKLEAAIEEAASYIESANTTTNANLITRLMRYVYEMLPIPRFPSISNCAWYCQYLFQENGGIYFNELIAYWIMEGYFEYCDNIDVAYREAHLVLMELVDRGILRVEDNYVSIESDAMKLPDYRRIGLSGSSCLGLPCVLDRAKWEGLGRVTQTHGIIKGSHWTRKEICSVLIDGTRLCREVLERFCEPKKLKILVILNPKFKEMPQVFSELTELQVLVLRACTLLEKVDEIQKLTKLIVLEISGACLLNKMHDDLFNQMTDLRLINLSEAGIQALPSSLLHQAELRWLILRRCLNLKLEPGQSFPVKLEVIDLSGSSLISNLSRRIKVLENLQTLDISQTKIGRLPFFENMPKLSRLLLSDCQCLNRLPTLKELDNLEILDCSKSRGLKEVQDDSLKAKVLDLSFCPVQKLPSMSNQSHILLEGCVSLIKFPTTQALKDLVVLDLSHASNFENFEDGSFEHLKSLRELNLSKTKIQKLPPLSPLAELRRFLLQDCSRLEDLSGLSTLVKLEVLDLSECCKLEIKENECFKGMVHLKELNLSHTKVTSLPSDCFPEGLCQLLIRGCTDLKELPSLESLSNLEVLDLCGLKSLSSKESKYIKDMTKLRRLDLSGVVVDEFPYVANLTNLTELSLRGLSYKVSELGIFDRPDTLSNLRKLSLQGFEDLGDMNLTSLSQLEDLDLSEIERGDYPYEISKLTDLRKLRLQVKKKITEIDWKRVKHIPEYFNLDVCGSQSTEDDSIQTHCSPDLIPDNSPSIVIFGSGFFEFLEKGNNSQLWDKCFDRFHFSVWPPRKEDGKQIDEKAYYLGERDLLRDIESQSRIPQPGGYHTDLKRYLEIHGSYGLLSPHKDVLTRADHISLIDDSSIASVSMVGVDILKSKKSCWLERCEKIRCVIDGDVEGTALNKLEDLYLYSLSSLEYICNQDLQSQLFMGLKRLLIECCPKLSKVFHFSQLPENLETLEIRFCDGMEILFHPEATKCNLRNLHLIALSSLKTIGATLLSLEKLKVKGCPELSSITVPYECKVVDDGKVQINRMPK